jgi:hypothetical protein
LSLLKRRKLRFQASLRSDHQYLWDDSGTESRYKTFEFEGIEQWLTKKQADLPGTAVTRPGSALA